ncbi:MAG: hypothetical protein QNK04_09045 [Myxococcota bacterium]|nr:hypothetical protein [Myxococcota bacterium]
MWIFQRRSLVAARRWESEIALGERERDGSGRTGRCQASEARGREGRPPRGRLRGRRRCAGRDDDDDDDGGDDRCLASDDDDGEGQCEPTYDVYLSTAELRDPSWKYWLGVPASDGLTNQRRQSMCEWETEVPGRVSVERLVLDACSAELVRRADSTS